MNVSDRIEMVANTYPNGPALVSGDDWAFLLALARLAVRAEPRLRAMANPLDVDDRTNYWLRDYDEATK